MSTNNIREEIYHYFLANPDSPLSNFEVAERFNFLPGEPRHRRSNLVKKIKYRVKKESPENLVLRSKWQVPQKDKDPIWLESYRAKESEFQLDFLEAKEFFLTELSDRDDSTPRKETPIQGPDPVAVEVGIFDYHFGKIDGRTILEQVEDYLKAVERAVHVTKNQFVERFIVPIGNDLFTIDNTHYQTTRGTDQRMNCTYQEMYKYGTLAIVKSIELLLKHAPVDVIVVPGNHDRILSMTCGEVVKAYFRNQADVNIIDSENSRIYYTYGCNLLGYTHGDRGKKESLPLLMAIESPQEFARATNRMWRVGHFHHHNSIDIKGIEITILPTLSRADQWHKDEGYLSSYKCHTSIFSKEFGFRGYLL